MPKMLVTKFQPIWYHKGPYSLTKVLVTKTQLDSLTYTDGKIVQRRISRCGRIGPGSSKFQRSVCRHKRPQSSHTTRPTGHTLACGPGSVANVWLDCGLLCRQTDIWNFALPGPILPHRELLRCTVLPSVYVSESSRVLVTSTLVRLYGPLWYKIGWNLFTSILGIIYGWTQICEI